MREYQHEGMGAVFALAFALGGRSLIVAGDGVAVRDMSAGTWRRLLPDTIDSLALVPGDREMLVSLRADAALLRLDLTDGRMVSVLPPPNRGGRDWWPHPAFLADGRTLAVGMCEEILLLRANDLDAGPFRRIGRRDANCDDLRACPDGTFATTHTARHGSAKWIEFHGSDGSPIRRIDSPDWLSEEGWLELAVARDGSRLAVAVNADTHWVELLSVPSGDRIHLPGKMRSDVRSPRFSPDGRHLAAVESVNTVCVWNLRTGGEPTRLDAGIGPCFAVEWAPDGLTLVAGYSDGRVVFWDAGE